jgi:hypothetical protein
MLEIKRVGWAGIVGPATRLQVYVSLAANGRMPL